jgi:hypothetical protein
MERNSKIGDVSRSAAEDNHMERDTIKTQTRTAFIIRRLYWLIAVLLLLLTLAGCLTSYAAGPANPADAVFSHDPTTVLPITPTLTATVVPGVTEVPNLVARAFQTLTPTPTITITPLAATATPTAMATDTPTPTPTSAPQATATVTPFPTSTPRPTAIPVTVSPFQAYAWLDNYFPAPGSVVTVYGRLFINGRPVNGAQMGVTWDYTHGNGYCTAYTGIDGQAACAQNIGAPLRNYWVYVDVVFVFEDELYYAKTAFLVDP